MIELLDLVLRCEGLGSTESAANVVEAVDIELRGEEGRIRYPQTLYTDIFFRNGGWRNLSGIEVDDRTIRARFTLNPLNRPSLEIDRVSGAVIIRAMSGTGFRGECRPVDLNERRF